eukprot:4960508-Pleurochrysis_carterae.AAC.5
MCAYQCANASTPARGRACVRFSARARACVEESGGARGALPNVEEDLPAVSEASKVRAKGTADG